MKENISPCGIDCGACYCYGEMCKGCNQCKGQVFYKKEGQTCELYQCVKDQKKYPHCGMCKEVPCTIWKETRDPKYTDEEFQNLIDKRINILKEKM